MKYNIIVVGNANNPIVDEFSNQAFDIIQSVVHAQKGTVGFADTWKGAVNGSLQTINGPAILFVREEQTIKGVRITLVGGVNEPTDTDTIRIAYEAALSGTVTTGNSGSGGPGGQNGGGGFGFGNGSLSLSGLFWILAAGYTAYRYTKK